MTDISDKAVQEALKRITRGCERNGLQCEHWHSFPYNVCLGCIDGNPFYKHRFVPNENVGGTNAVATFRARYEADARVIEAAKALAADYKAIIDAIKSVPALLPNTSREARFTPEMDECLTELCVDIVIAYIERLEAERDALLAEHEAVAMMLPLCGLDWQAEGCDDPCDVCTLPPVHAAHDNAERVIHGE